MYGKLFASIYDGSMYGHWEALVTFQQMICLANRDGVVDMTPAALSARTSIPLEIIQTGIAHLLLPDPESRSPECDGRRIETIDSHRSWGWRIVNYEHYRKLASTEDKLLADRERIAKKREDEKAASGDDVASCRKVSQGVVNVAHVEVDAEVEVKAKKKVHTSSTKKSKPNPQTPLPPDFAISDTVRAWAQAHSYYRLEERLAHFKDAATAKGYQYVDWEAAFRNAIRDDWAKLGMAPPPDPSYDLTPTFTDEEAADLCLHGRFQTPAFRAKHGDRPDVECVQCQQEREQAVAP